MKTLSLKTNMVLNAIRSILSLLFPLITFPYVSRILGAENLGKHNFANSIVSYFVMISALGIYSYAVREGARFRNQKDRFSRFANEVFSINILSTVIAYILLFVSLASVSKLHDYNILFYILSLQIVLKTLSVEWIYTIYEDFLYITVRSIVIQIVSLVLLFIFVKSQNDLYAYTIVVTLATAGSSIFNYLYVKKYHSFKFVKTLNLKSHAKPILIIFATSIAITIFVSSDVTILGFLCDDTTVGIYSVSVKVYTIIKQVMIAILSVVIPRLAYYLGKKAFDEFKNTVDDLFKTMISILLPAVVGIFVLSKEIVYIVGGNQFISAYTSLQLLSIALIFCMFSWSWGQCVLITFKQEILLLISTVVSAMVNVVFNLILIPFYRENAAAFTTILAEAITMGINWWYGRKYIRVNNLFKVTAKVLLGCLIITMINFLLRCYKWNNIFIFSICDITLCALGYLLTEIIVKNEVLIGMLNQFKEKIAKRSNY